jgi:hypothetical protein
MAQPKYTLLSDYLNTQQDDAKKNKFKTRELIRLLEIAVGSKQLLETYPHPESHGFKFLDGKFEQATGTGVSRDYVIFNLTAFSEWFESVKEAIKPKDSGRPAKETKTLEEIQKMNPEARAKYFETDLEKLKKKHEKEVSSKKP